MGSLILSFTRKCFYLSLIVLVFTSCSKNDDKETKKVLLNVSYDPTREMYQEINAAFIDYWKKEKNELLEIQQSHGGSGKQARSVIDGLQADVVTLALAYDIDAIAERTKLIPSDWQKRLPNNSCPYTSTIVFVVRKGNPKKIMDWDDLIHKDVSIITPNPKTSGGARWNYLAAWAYALEKFKGDEKKVKEFMAKIFANVPVLDSGARSSANTFVQREIGDVFLSWENEALLITNTIDKDKFEIVLPSISILAEPAITVVDGNAKTKNNLEVANEYLKFLYSEKGQDIEAKHFYRPSNKKIFDKYSKQFKDTKLIQIDNTFGGWKNAQKIHFDDGGTFDEIYTNMK